MIYKVTPTEEAEADLVRLGHSIIIKSHIQGGMRD